MKIKKHIKSIYTLLSVIGLVVLLFVSPCKVRNFIQAKLDISQTEVNNKSKTSFSNSNCYELNDVINTTVKEQKTPQYSPAIIAENNLFRKKVASDSSSQQKQRTSNHSTSTIPLYILYQNFKDYL